MTALSARREPSPGARLALDYGPLVAFFIVNFAAPGDWCRRVVATFTPSLGAMTQVEALLVARSIVATVFFILATLAAIIWSRIAFGRVSPMLLISGALVLVFGGLTIWLHDPRFIQMKPTVVYSLLAGILGFGLATSRPLLDQLLGTAYPGLSAAGWRRLTINWTLFFVALAVANEVARATLSYDHWVLFKFPGCVVATFLFAVANVPMLLRHGLTLEDGATEEGAATRELPPE